MSRRVFTIIFISILLINPLSGQSLFDSYNNSLENSAVSITGFVRGAIYAGQDDAGDFCFPHTVSDLSLKLTAGNSSKFKAYADFRIREGIEFGTHSSNIWLNEGWVALYGKKMEIVVGKQVVKWGRTDMFNPVSRLNPRDDLYRSPDRADLDLGNMMIRAKFSPVSLLSFEFVTVPYYSPSVLPVRIMSLPEYVSFENSKSVITGKSAVSFGLRGEMHLRGADIGLSWFNGYNHLPGIGFDGFEVYNLGPPVEAEMVISENPYGINMFGIDGEISFLGSGFRWEVAYIDQLDKNIGLEYVPLPELNLVAGIDRQIGNWHFQGEYLVKKILEFTPVSVGPEFSGDDLLNAFLIMTPEEIGSQVILQLSSFNRLYNYQIEEYYHSAGLHITRNTGSSLFNPEFITLYNFTTEEVLFIPSVRIVPADGISISIGGEYWQGPDDSLYQMIHRPLNGLYLSFRYDF